jgi:hypothetical protein
VKGFSYNKRVTVEKPPAGALLASKKNKVKPVTKVGKKSPWNFHRSIKKENAQTVLFFFGNTSNC